MDDQNTYMNPVTLSFSDAMEPQFQEEYHARFHRQMRWMLGIGVFLFAGFTLSDVVFAPESAPAIYWIRYGVVVPGVLICWGLSYWSGFQQWMHWIVTAACMLTGFGMAAAIAIFPYHLAMEYHAAIGISMVFTYALVRTRFIFATVAGTAMMAAYLWSLVHFHEPSFQEMYTNFGGLIGFNAVGMTAAYLLELQFRENYLLNLNLQQSELRTRALLDVVPDALLLLDRNGNVLHHSPTDGAGFLDSSGLGPIWGQIHKQVMESVHQVLDSDEPRLFEVEAHIEEAPPTSYEIRVQPVTDQQALVMSRDITIRRAEETKQRDYDEAMRQRQKLESLGVLTGGIAHDFNNLLAVILGYTDLMLRSKELDSAQVLQAQRVKAAAEQASDLTDQMLAYAGRQPIQTSRVQLSELVKGMSDLLRTAVGSRARLEYHFSPNLPPIQASPSQLSQILLNFVTNAAEACEQKGSCIRVTTLTTELKAAYLSECESLEPLPGGMYVILEVTDDGEGMDESVRLRMFEPFFTTKFTGRGMGLPSVVGIVHSHGGAIHVANTEGGGCTIRAIFPMATQAFGDAVDTSRSHSQDLGWATGGRVLVVDDDANVRSVAVQMLKRMGLEVLEASGGKEAVSMFKKRAQDFSLILLDLTMPEMDGTAVLQAIHAENPETRVILCSGYAEADFFGRFTGNPKVGALHKPFTYAELQESVQKALLS